MPGVHSVASHVTKNQTSVLALHNVGTLPARSAGVIDCAKSGGGKHKPISPLPEIKHVFGARKVDGTSQCQHFNTLSNWSSTTELRTAGLFVHCATSRSVLVRYIERPIVSAQAVSQSSPPAPSPPAHPPSPRHLPFSFIFTEKGIHKMTSGGCRGIMYNMYASVHVNCCPHAYIIILWLSLTDVVECFWSLMDTEGSQQKRCATSPSSETQIDHPKWNETESSINIGQRRRRDSTEP